GHRRCRRQGRHQWRARALCDSAGRDRTASAAHGLCSAHWDPFRWHAISEGYRQSRARGSQELTLLHAARHERSRSFPMNIALAAEYFTDLQARLVARLEAIDGGVFLRDAWQRPEGGGGISQVIEQGRVFERGGVN